MYRFAWPCHLARLILHCVQSLQKMKSPRGFKTHMPFRYKLGGDLESSPAKYIYTYRNPKDTAVSFYHFVKGYAPLMDWETFIEKFLEGSLMYGKVLEHLMGWWEQQGEKIKCNVNSGQGFCMKSCLLKSDCLELTKILCQIH